jgi:hypothetical protein
MKTTLQILGAVVVVCAGLLYIVINHSTITRELTCVGSLTNGSDRLPDTAHVQLIEYRWWVHLWSDSDGNAKAQLEDFSSSIYISNIKKIGDGSLALYQFKDDDGNNLVGGYREANGEITFRLASGLTFTGDQCRVR